MLNVAQVGGSLQELLEYYHKNELIIQEIHHRRNVIACYVMFAVQEHLYETFAIDADVAGHLQESLELAFDPLPHRGPVY